MLSETLYRFHKDLNRPFGRVREVIETALRLTSKHVPSDVLTSFVLRKSEGTLAAELSVSGSITQETEEEICVLNGSPLQGLLERRKKFWAVSDPYPIVYVPVGGRGVLRFQRLRRKGKRSVFAEREVRLALELANELAQRLDQAEISHRSRRQLRRTEALTELTALFASSLRVEDGLKLILQGVQRHFALDRVRLYLVQRSTQTLRGEMSVDMRGEIRSLRSDEMPIIPREHRFVDILLGLRSDPWREEIHCTALHVPLTVQGNGIGLLILDNLVSQSPIPEEDMGLLKSFAGQIALAVDNSRLFDEVQALSLHDDLTGLPLRRFFQQRFGDELYRAERAGQPLSLALIDIDYFKSINDTYGHQVGDQVLKEAGKVISATLRKADFPCRYGGDEVMILLPQVLSPEACRIMSRLSQRLKEIRIPVPFSKVKEVRITASIGVSSYPSDGRSLEELTQKADEALYWIKSHGRDGVASAPGGECVRGESHAVPADKENVQTVMYSRGAAGKEGDPLPAAQPKEMAPEE